MSLKAQDTKPKKSLKKQQQKDCKWPDLSGHGTIIASMVDVFMLRKLKESFKDYKYLSISIFMKMD